MSTTYTIACDDCEESYWCGQSDYLYDPSVMMNFLKKHEGHRLKFINDLTDSEEIEDYTEYDELSQSKKESR